MGLNGVQNVAPPRALQALMYIYGRCARTDGPYLARRELP